MNHTANDFKELVRSRTDIVQLIGEFVSLHPQNGGRLYKGLCPFHDDHNPSLTVNPVMQIYKCWSCGEGGDCFSFIMKHQGVDFPQALAMLAKRAGLQPPQSSGRSRAFKYDKNRIYEILRWASERMHRYLLEDPAASRVRDYLKTRGFSHDVVRKFQVGYHPPMWDWFRAPGTGCPFSEEDLIQAGLIEVRRDAPGVRDKFIFYDRLMFPICNEWGQCVAFGGRILPDSRYQQAGKYLNSDDSPIFQKGRTLYGLHLARDALRRTGVAIVMEGYVDCIKAHQAGLVHAVATLGTALTEMHVNLLKRFAQRAILVYDGDRAGRQAAIRAVEKFLLYDFDLRVLILPDELDPDEFLERDGAQEFMRLVESAPEWWSVVYEGAVRQYGLDTSAARLQVAEELLRLLLKSSALEGSLKESSLLREWSERLRLPEAHLRKHLSEMRAAQHSSRQPRADYPNHSEEGLPGEDRERKVISLQRSTRRDDLLDCELIQIILTEPSWLDEIRAWIGCEDVWHPLLREIFQVCIDLHDVGIPPTFQHILHAVDCPHLKRILVWLNDRAGQLKISQKLRDDTGTTPPLLLRQILNALVVRRQRRALEQDVAKILPQASNGTSRNEIPLELLTRTAELQRQRMLHTYSSGIAPPEEAPPLHES